MKTRITMQELSVLATRYAELNAATVEINLNDLDLDTLVDHYGAECDLYADADAGLTTMAKISHARMQHFALLRSRQTCH